MNFKSNINQNKFSLSDSKKIFSPISAKGIHKGDRGHLWVIGGRIGYLGSSIMASRASIRCGTGYCTLISTFKEIHNVSIVYPDIMTETMNLPNEIWDTLKRPTAIVIGPGFGLSPLLEQTILFLIEKAHEIPVLLDADALTCLASFSRGFKLPSQWILTPHEGEMARLLGVSSEDVKINRISSLQSAFEKFQCNILLKGPNTAFISVDSKKVYLIDVGGPVLAKAGTGDVLAGMIGGLLAQRFNSEKATLQATYWHGAFGDWYVNKYGNDFSLRASEISDLLPIFWKEHYQL